MSRHSPPRDSVIADGAAAMTPAWVKLGVAVAAALGLVGLGVMLGYGLAGPAGQNSGAAKVIAPIERLTQRPSSRDTLPDLVDDACSAIVRLGPAPAPAITTTAQSHGHTRAKAHAKPQAQPQPLPLGVMVAPDGAILTTRAAIGAATQVSVRLSDGTAATALPIASDALSGLVLLRVAANRQPTITLAEGDLPRIGAFAFALAAQTDHGCLVQPGYVSGDFAAEGGAGPIFARFAGLPPKWPAGTPVMGEGGMLVGLAGAVTDPARHGHARPSLDGRLLPPAVIRQFLSEALRGRSDAIRGAGLLAMDITDVLAERLGSENQQGAAVVAVGQDTPAARAGLVPGDIIVAVADRPVANAAELGRLLAGPGVGSAGGSANGTGATSLTVLRNELRRQVQLPPS